VTSSLFYRALRPWLRGYAKADQRVDRVRSALAHFAEGFVLSGLNASEQTDLTVAIYDQRAGRTESLFVWEKTWFEAVLPQPPARVLVGGAGRGREVLALRAFGYAVDAFEPTPSSGPQLSAAVGSGLALTGSHEDLARACQGEPSPLAALAAQRYDAVLLGWTSLSHVLDTRERYALFEACQIVCPRGPILGSFFLSYEPAFERISRARAWGTELGAKLARARGFSERAPAPGFDRFLIHAGITHVFERAELEALGHSIGRTLELEPMPYAHATWLVPPSTR
jgi:hypothetical protein